MPFSDDELKEAVAFNLEKIRDAIQKDGGDIDFLDVRNGVVFVQLRGACLGCASSDYTLKFLVEAHLKSHIHQNLIIKNVPLGYENRLEEV
ncbi:MAG: NifU family protein [Helicobacteraceae bacterium]